ncbi:hypothetical protein JYU34_004528 [Plutella xylostella]|uniref:Homeobox domain-containing protein n=1 Tax=Plutella xylostella TaxID=51655 RepID=A0ABQ7QY92_PLUXY|nr:hypothetical protein JYU34_004528 [Plutella xylostella]
MFQNMLMTGFTSLNATNENDCWDNRPFITKWPEIQNNQQKKVEEVTKTIKKKHKRTRTAFTTEQILYLEHVFKSQQYIDRQKRIELAKRIRIGERHIKIWFQNRRMKKKRESESSSDVESSGSSPPPVVTSSTTNEEPSLLQQYVESFAIPDSEHHYVDPYQENGQLPPQYVPNMFKSEEQEQYQLPNYTPPEYGYEFSTDVYPTEYYPNATEVIGNYNDFYQPEEVMSAAAAGACQPPQNNNGQDQTWYEYNMNYFQNGYGW